MNSTYRQLLVTKRRVKRRIKKKAEIADRCYHCSGAFRGSEDIETCLMCGREKGHLCSNCMHVPEESLDQEKKWA
jgi:rRNA maturation endonuclease Nob1